MTTTRKSSEMQNNQNNKNTKQLPRKIRTRCENKSEHANQRSVTGTHAPARIMLYKHSCTRRKTRNAQHRPHTTHHTPHNTQHQTTRNTQHQTTHTTHTKQHTTHHSNTQHNKNTRQHQTRNTPMKGRLGRLCVCVSWTLRYCARWVDTARHCAGLLLLETLYLVLCYCTFWTTVSEYSLLTVWLLTVRSLRSRRPTKDGAPK